MNLNALPRRVRRYSDDPDSPRQQSGSSAYLRTRRGRRELNSPRSPDASELGYNPPMFGSHLSIAGGMHHALLEAESLGMDMVQAIGLWPQ